MQYQIATYGWGFFVMSKDTFYFSHDFNARSDRKMINLQTKHGMYGVGIYWCIIEMLFEEAGYLSRDYDSIAFELRTEYDGIKSVVEDFNLFQFDDDNFWSESCIERMKKRMEVSDSARENVNKRWDKYRRNTSVEQTKEIGNTIKEREGEKKKTEKKKFIPPVLSDVIIFFNENGYTKDHADKVFKYYSEAEWIDSKGKSVSNWKQKMRGNWFKDDGKLPLIDPEVFYQKEVDGSDGDESYRKYTAYIYGDNSQGREYKGILSITEQLTFNEFKKLRQHASNNNKNLSNVLDAIESKHTYTDGAKSLYAIIKKFIG